MLIVTLATNNQRLYNKKLKSTQHNLVIKEKLNENILLLLLGGKNITVPSDAILSWCHLSGGCYNPGDDRG